MLRAPIRKPQAPAIPLPDREYSKTKLDQIFNALRIYFNSVNRAVGQLADTLDGFNSYLSDTSLHLVAGTTAPVTVAADYVPLVSFQLASDSLTSTVVPFSCTLVTADDSTFQVALIKNGVLTGESFDTTTYAHVDFDIAATDIDITDATIITTKFIKGVTTVNLLGSVDRTLQFVDTDIYTLAAKVLDGGSGDISGSIEVIDYV